MLKLRRLEVENVGKFTRPVCVQGLTDGLNVLAAPNEAGKSTLMRALLAAIFTRYRTTGSALDELRDAGSRTHPEVRLDFDLDDDTYRLKKRFAGQSGRAWLESTRGVRFQNEEAECELQRLLGFDRPARKADLGVWGALWVRQAESLCEADLDETGRSAITGCLGTQIGVATCGVKGRQIRRAISARREQLLTKGGRPTGQYAKLIERVRILTTELSTLDVRRRELASKLVELGEVERTVRRLEREGEEVVLQRQLEEARANLQQARQHASELEAARRAAEGAQARLDEIRGEQQRRSDLVRELEELRDAETGSQRRVSAAKGRVAELDCALEEVRQQHARCKDERKAVDTERDRLSRLRDFAHQASELAAKEKVLEELRQLHERARSVRRELEENRLTRELLQSLREADHELEKTKARAAGAATNIAFDIAADELGRVCVNGEHLRAGHARLQVLERTRIAIDGVGTIDVQPQVGGARRLKSELEQAEANLRHLLERASVPDLDAATRSAARREELGLELRHLANEIERLAPGDQSNALEPGADALAAHLEAKRAELKKALVSLGVDSFSDLPALATELGSRNEQLKALDRRLEEIESFADRMGDERLAAGEHAATCATELRGTIELLKQTGERLAAATTHRGDQTLREQSEHWTQERATALHRERELSEQEVPELGLAEQKVARLEQALDEHRRQVATLANQRAALRATIEAREGEGLEETIATGRGELERAEAEVRRFEDDANALVLLEEVLSEAERAARDRYLEPVIRKLRPHLNHLWPGAVVQLNEQFKIQALVRADAAEHFARLSDGTREQLAVLTRLSLAELLLDQGKPAMLVLDDALVFSDDDRIERMFDILNRAAERLQILVFTCRTRSFRRLGGHALTLCEAGDQVPPLAAA